MHPGDRRERACCGVQQSLGWLISTPYATQFLWFRDFSGEQIPFSCAPLRSRFKLISVKLLISLISRHAAKRLDLTGQAWASTETTDLQAKLRIGNFPKPGAACWMESCMMIPGVRLQGIPQSLLTSQPAALHFNSTFTFLRGDAGYR